MNLLVTGGAGFIGANLIHVVIDRPEVVRLVNLDCLTYAGHLENLVAVERHPKYCFERVDLRDATEVMRVVKSHAITHVIHLAAESHVDRSISGPAQFIHANVVGTFNLLEACRACWLNPEPGTRNPEPGTRNPESETRNPKPAARFHYVSTDEVYGSLGKTGAFTETSPFAPRSPYSASKAAGDLLARSYFHTYGLPVVITNCSNNYGPFQHPEKLIPVVIQKVLSRQPIPVYGRGSNVRDWLFVRDHVAALWTVLCAGRLGESYNVGANNEQANLELVGQVCDIIDELKPGLGGGSRELISFVADRPGHDFRYALDTTKIRSELRWEPACAFEQGLRETVAWYLDNQAWVASVTSSTGSLGTNRRSGLSTLAGSS